MVKEKNQIGARERILKTACELFYSRGINNVGIDEIIARSGVAKMSLYNHFKSKDELIVAFLEQINAQWLPGMNQQINKLSPKPEGRLLAFFDALGIWFKSKEFRGCPFINTATEISDKNHRAYKAALNCKKGMFNYVQELVKEAGVRDSKNITNQILLLIDGAVVSASMTKNADSAKFAKQACESLIKNAKMKK